MRDGFRRKLPGLTNFAVDGIVLELQCKKFQRARAQRKIGVWRLSIGYLLAQTRGEAGKFFDHAVFVCRLVFRDSRNKILADSDIAARKDLRFDFAQRPDSQCAQMQKVRRSLWIVLWVLALILFLYPINSLPLRLAFLGLTIGAYCSLIWFFRNRKPVSYGLIALAFLIGAFLVCPGTNTD